MIRITLQRFTSSSPIIWRIPGKLSQVAITFDDGPTDYTPAILDVLAANQIHATFFLLGQWVDMRPAMVTRMVREGHEIGIHGYDHTFVKFTRQVHRCARDITAFGITTRILRPPCGTIRFLPTLRLWLQGYRTVLFDVDTHDSMRYEGKWPDVSVDFSKISGGSIIMMHDDNPYCIEDLHVLVKILKEMNLTPVTVGELLSFKGTLTGG